MVIIKFIAPCSRTQKLRRKKAFLEDLNLDVSSVKREPIDPPFTNEEDSLERFPAEGTTPASPDRGPHSPQLSQGRSPRKHKATIVNNKNKIKVSWIGVLHLGAYCARGKEQSKNCIRDVWAISLQRPCGSWRPLPNPRLKAWTRMSTITQIASVVIGNVRKVRFKLVVPRVMRCGPL